MKRYVLLFMFMCSAVLTFGQLLKMTTEVPFKQQTITDQDTYTSALKGGGDMIWGTTFNWKNVADPKGWTLPVGWTVKDNFEIGNLWVWRNDTLKGINPVTAPSWFTTASDGFICLPMDEYNSLPGITFYTPADAYIETPPINCKGVPSVIVKFNQYFNYCCRNYNLEMLVTNDGGVHWATYDAKFGVDGNTFTPTRFRSVEINISDIAAGFANVQIRFYMQGPTHYFWMIDDLRLTEAYPNDLVLEDYWMDFDGGMDPLSGHINYWPQSQMNMPGATSGTVGNYFFKAAILNNGMSDAKNVKLGIKVLKNGIQVHNDQSLSTTLRPLQRDTQRITNPYLAKEVGDYRFDYSAISDNPEDVPINNTVSLFFTLNDTLAHRADFTAESSSNTGGWKYGDNKGDMVGVAYNLYAPAEINSITAYLAGFKAYQAPQFQFVMMKSVGGIYEEWISSDVINMDSSYRHIWVTLPVIKDGETEFLDPGNYAACVRMWGTDPGDTTNGSNGLSVGWDMTTKPSGTLMYLSAKDNWYSTDKLNMIGFNISGSGIPAYSAATFNVDMTKHIESGHFKPDTDYVDVYGSFSNWTGSVHMTDPEADGIYTIIINGLPVGKVIEYKYRINGNWSTAEYPNGGPNRKYTVRYWNILNDIYNGGITAGVNHNGLLPSFNVYPNPTNSAFTVGITNTAPSDLQITLTNIRGQVVYLNRITNVISHRETIDSKLTKGLYFLSVNNGKEVKVVKIVVQ
ncbi:MAG: T9SS type A sorting domain-containing protein [Bacteroidia bacterium]|nr:T9SS type A sorting domain-containing protein [Bacteroidia bacterium]